MGPEGKMLLFRVTFLKRGEVYNVTLPYANCKGIMVGTMTMELAGPVSLLLY